jgi:hypothetical protein
MRGMVTTDRIGGKIFVECDAAHCVGFVNSVTKVEYPTVIGKFT